MSDTSTATRPPEVFSARVAIILFVVGVFGFSAFVTLSTFAPGSSQYDPDAHALSRSAIGYAGLVKLARLNGAAVRIARTPAGQDARETKLVILTPDEKLSFTDLDAAGYWTTLVILPKWYATMHSSRLGWVGRRSALEETEVEGILAEIAPGAKVTRGLTPIEPVIYVEARQTRSVPSNALMRPAKIQDLQTVTAPNMTPVAQTKDGKTILGVIRNEDYADVYVLSDPDFLNNQGIAKLATAEVAIDILNMLRAPGEPIVFDVTLNGYASERNLLRLALQPPLLAATLSFMLVAALIAWRAATRDGPTVRRTRALTFGKRILAENSAALVRLAGREQRMAARYADLIRTVTAERVGFGREGIDATAVELDRLAEARRLSTPYSALAAEATAAQTGADALAAARKLHAWTEEMIRATR